MDPHGDISSFPSQKGNGYCVAIFSSLFLCFLCCLFTGNRKSVTRLGHGTRLGCLCCVTFGVLLLLLPLRARALYCPLLFPSRDLSVLDRTSGFLCLVLSFLIMENFFILGNTIHKQTNTNKQTNVVIARNRWNISLIFTLLVPSFLQAYCLTNIPFTFTGFLLCCGFQMWAIVLFCFGYRPIHLFLI